MRKMSTKEENACLFTQKHVAHHENSLEKLSKSGEISPSLAAFDVKLSGPKAFILCLVFGAISWKMFEFTVFRFFQDHWD